ncbi:hypothetical protein SLEP1_g18694 [Rubroshorea leprosula]|uniref:Pentatricopeptide repeat-containing protein n=1 Tax=Rubroshorea leprosula TaxID=152421 RepID=A0AAV5IYF6_9ROSI|nr:hypothetical protein SLEP1_g18694 [Rubroshorea leprosula]
MFRTLCSIGFVEEIPNLLVLMKEDGAVFGSETFKFLLNEFIRFDRFDSTLEILDHMEELGTNLNPSVCGTVLVALVRKNQVGLALSIFLKLLEASNGIDNGDSSLLPGSIAFNELLVALRKAIR